MEGGKICEDGNGWHGHVTAGAGAVKHSSVRAETELWLLR